MWMVVGLGNPGARYAATRHNVGFLVADEIAARHGLGFREKKDSLFCSGSIDGYPVLIMKPMTFMNRSGVPVRKIADKFTVPPDRIIAVYDDLDLEVGTVKIRRKGSSGGHKGISSLIEHLGSQEFSRVKIGIGRDPDVPVERFVLSRFRRDEKPHIAEAVMSAADAVEGIVTYGIDKAMNRFNRA